MRKIEVVFYQCGICGAVCPTKEKTKKCEKQGIALPKYSLGNTIEYHTSWGSMGAGNDPGSGGSIHIKGVVIYIAFDRDIYFDIVFHHKKSGALYLVETSAGERHWIYDSFFDGIRKTATSWEKYVEEILKQKLSKKEVFSSKFNRNKISERLEKKFEYWKKNLKY